MHVNLCLLYWGKAEQSRDHDRKNGRGGGLRYAASFGGGPSRRVAWAILNSATLEDVGAALLTVGLQVYLRSYPNHFLVSGPCLCQQIWLLIKPLGFLCIWTWGGVHLLASGCDDLELLISICFNMQMHLSCCIATVARIGQSNDSDGAHSRS